jgi:hypothetical protein
MFQFPEPAFASAVVHEIWSWQMAKTPTWKRPDSPIGKKKKNPKYHRKSGDPWSAQDMKDLRGLVRQNTPTRVIGLKLQRPETAIRAKAQREGISLKPTNQSPNKGRKKG